MEISEEKKIEKKFMCEKERERGKIIRRSRRSRSNRGVAEKETRSLSNPIQDEPRSERRQNSPAGPCHQRDKYSGNTNGFNYGFFGQGREPCS